MSIKGGKLDFLHKSKKPSGFLGETKPSTAAYINVREERRRVSTTKSPTRLTYAGSLFITFEGGEGCGKSTQSNMLSQYLLSQNIPTDLTREVGGTIVAEKMRDILVHQDLLPMSELLQVMAARYEHVHKRIIPKLNSGVSVICDRFVDSTACYQGQEVGTDLVYELHKSLISSVMPDITFFIDIEPNIALARACARGNNNKFENKNIEFHQKVYNRFQYISDKFPDRIVKINASALSANEIHDIIVVMLTRKLEKTI